MIPASNILKKDIASSQENIAVSFANYRNAKSPETGNLDIPVNVTSIINNTASADEQGSNNGASANGGYKFCSGFCTDYVGYSE